MARKERYLVGLDVGTSKITALVGEAGDEGELDIIGIGLADSKGIRRGVVVNLEAAVESIKMSVHLLEQRSPLVDSEQVVQFAEDYLARHPWFGGSEFSAADIMMKFPLDFGTALNVVDGKQFPNVAAWKTKIEARPAYQQMLAKARARPSSGAESP